MLLSIHITIEKTVLIVPLPKILKRITFQNHFLKSYKVIIFVINLFLYRVFYPLYFALNDILF